MGRENGLSEKEVGLKPEETRVLEDSDEQDFRLIRELDRTLAIVDGELLRMETGTDRRRKEYLERNHRQAEAVIDGLSPDQERKADEYFQGIIGVEGGHIFAARVPGSTMREKWHGLQSRFEKMSGEAAGTE